MTRRPALWPSDNDDYVDEDDEDEDDDDDNDDDDDDDDDDDEEEDDVDDDHFDDLLQIRQRALKVTMVMLITRTMIMTVMFALMMTKKVRPGHN
ncbi:hypothetical protein ElyMa_001286500 [Elysia marginata]|uniref:Uncharacterized protein n=1 Tax=Elysia marginata TaxID=1093978 RepID=A0AAV4IID2_9GAST|nr:hypothetical protein ElyMa_001286500 [Elysia marginata]